MKPYLRIAILLLLLGSFGCDDPWDDPRYTNGLTKNTVFELTQDVYLYCYCGQYGLVRPAFARFTMDQFRNDPSIGVVDEAANIAFKAIVPKGTRVKFTALQRKIDLNGIRYIPCGIILDARFAGYRKVNFHDLLARAYNETSGKCIRVVAEGTNGPRSNP